MSCSFCIVAVVVHATAASVMMLYLDVFTLRFLHISYVYVIQYGQAAAS